MRTQRRWQGLALLVVLWTAAAQAQDGAPTDAQMHEAEQRYQDGQDAFDLGHYDQAIGAWEKSYALSHAPGLLFNLGQAARLKGDCTAALRYYQNDLRLDPTADNKQAVEGFVAEMQKCAGQREQAQPIAASPPRRPASAPVTADAPGRPGHTKKVVGLVLAGAGVLLVGTGLYFGSQATSKADQVTSACAMGCDWAAQKGADSDGRQAETLQWVFYGAAAATVIGGAVVYYLGVREGREAPRIAATPLRGGGAEMVASWAW